MTDMRLATAVATAAPIVITCQGCGDKQVAPALDLQRRLQQARIDTASLTMGQIGALLKRPCPKCAACSYLAAAQPPQDPILDKLESTQQAVRQMEERSAANAARLRGLEEGIAALAQGVPEVPALREEGAVEPPRSRW